MRIYHSHEFPFLERSVVNPLDVAIECAADILTDGEFPFEGFLAFVAERCPDFNRASDEDLVAAGDAFAAVKLRRTNASVRENADGWTRKIRHGIEQELWKRSEYRPVIHRGKTMYFRCGNGDPLSGGKQWEPEEILAGLLRIEPRPETMPALLIGIFGIISEREDHCHALTVELITTVIIRFHEILFTPMGDEAVDGPVDPIDDRVRRAMELTLDVLRSGRLRSLVLARVITRDECASMMRMATMYIEDIFRQRSFGRLKISHYLSVAFPVREATASLASDRKRIADILRLVRLIFAQKWRETGASSPNPAD